MKKTDIDVSWKASFPGTVMMSGMMIEQSEMVYSATIPAPLQPGYPLKTIQIEIEIEIGIGIGIGIDIEKCKDVDFDSDFDFDYPIMGGGSVAIHS
jgi:hypothetical protein